MRAGLSPSIARLEVPIGLNFWTLALDPEGWGLRLRAELGLSNFAQYFSLIIIIKYSLVIVKENLDLDQTIQKDQDDL